MSTPMSKIHICSGVRLNNDYHHTIWFDSEEDQLAYFMGKVVKTFSNYSYLRKSWTIKVDAAMEQARTWSYLFFQNGSGKYYYYFINNVEYINDNTAELFLELDVMQTYLKNYTLHPCFVEREHASTDEVGDNVLDEGLELGELVINTKSNMDMQELCILFLTSVNPLDPDADANMTSKHNGVFSGLGVYAVDMEDYYTFGSQLWGNATLSEAVVAIWMYPKKLVSANWETESIYKLVTGATALTDFTFAMPDNLGGYTDVKNNKLFTYPYNMLYVSNNAGGASVYKYERFDSLGLPAFRVCGAISPEGNTKLFPVNYNGQIINYDEGIMGANYPSCAWNQDVYKLWLAQNQHTQNLAMLTGGLQILAGAGTALATGGIGAMVGGGMFASGLSTIAGTLAQRADMDLQPPQAKGSYSSNVNIANEHQTFTVMNKSVSAYQAKIIDDYFSLYGYKTNLVKVPNRNVRENWTYTKTVGCFVSGNLCTDDLRKIQSIYDKGITFWKNGDNIGNYSLSNQCL